MNWIELLRQAEDLSDEGMREQLRSIMTDPRFPAVLRLLLGHEEAWAQNVSRQALCVEHGAIAHCAGSLHALQVLVEDLREKATAPAQEQPPTP